MSEALGDGAAEGPSPSGLSIRRTPAVIALWVDGYEKASSVPRIGGAKIRVQHAREEEAEKAIRERDAADCHLRWKATAALLSPPRRSRNTESWRLLLITEIIRGELHRA